MALGLWRVAEAIVGSKPSERSGADQDDTPAWKRAKSLGLAIVNFAIAFSAARFAMGRGQQSSQQNAGLSAQMMQSGWGKAVLILVGLGLVAVGGYHVYKGASKKFLKDLRVSGGTAVTAIGVTGYVAKGLVLAGAGVLVIVATLQADPVEGDGIRCRGQDTRSCPVREGPPHRGRAWYRGLRRIQLCAQSPRPHVAV